MSFYLCQLILYPAHILMSQQMPTSVTDRLLSFSIQRHFKKAAKHVSSVYGPTRMD